RTPLPPRRVRREGPRRRRRVAGGDREPLRRRGPGGDVPHDRGRRGAGARRGLVDARHGGGGPVSARRALAIFRRNYYVALHSPPVVLDLLLWPVLALMILGLLA